MADKIDSEQGREELALTVAATARAYARKEADSRLKRYRNQALIGFALLLAGFGFVTHEAAQDRHDARVRDAAGRSVICQIITSGDAQLYQYEREGTITVAQLNRGLAQSASYRRVLGEHANGEPAPRCDPHITLPPRTRPGQ